MHPSYEYQNAYSGDGYKACKLSSGIHHGNCSLSDSTPAAGHFPTYNCSSSSSSILSFSPNGSPIYSQDFLSSHQYSQSPDGNCCSSVSGSCMSEEANDLFLEVKELENAILGYGSDDFYLSKISAFYVLQPGRWVHVMEIPNGYLKHLLIACGRAVEDNNLVLAEFFMTELQKLVSVTGDPLQRVGAYLLECLVARLSSSGSRIYKALRCREPAGPELLSYMHMLYEVCPFFKFGYMSANGAIAEALKEENWIHIIDFQIAQGSQWVTLIRALGSRPGGASHVRITGIDDAMSTHARGGGLQIVGQRLAKLAEACNVPFEFHASPVSGSDVELEHLQIRPGEAIAVNFPYVLHHIPDESVSPDNHRDRLLRMIKSLSPKVVTLVEQECNTNTAPFFLRFMETFSYYYAMFESVDVALPRDSKERIGVEEQCLARDMVNLVACEGAERVERHEVLGKWRARFQMAGFTPYPLSSVVNQTIRSLLQTYSENYRLEEKDGALCLGWKEKALVTSCAWR